MKRLIAILLIMSICMSALTACGNNAAANAPETTTTTTEPTQPGEEGKRLKILTLGNSGALNCTHLLAHIAALEGYENFDVATLYYSGCSLAAHVNFLTQNTTDYWLYESSTDTPNVVPNILQSVSMKTSGRANATLCCTIIGQLLMPTTSKTRGAKRAKCSIRS